MCHENQSCSYHNSVFQNYFFCTTGTQRGALSGQPLSFFDLIWPKLESAGSKMWKKTPKASKSMKNWPILGQNCPSNWPKTGFIVIVLVEAKVMILLIWIGQKSISQGWKWGNRHWKYQNRTKNGHFRAKRCFQKSSKLTLYEFRQFQHPNLWLYCSETLLDGFPNKNWVD